jgi:hypothetical protein
MKESFLSGAKMEETDSRFEEAVMGNPLNENKYTVYRILLL